MSRILNVGDIKNGYEVYKMVHGEEQGGYSVSAFAKKDDFKYFMKMYHSPTVVSLPDQQEYFKNRIFKLMGKLGIPKIKNFIAQDKEFFLDEETGRYIKISELLTGTQLSKLLSSEPYKNSGVSLSEAIKYVTLISYAFRNIHEMGITHCDLKPDNIFIEERKTMSGKIAKTIVIIDFDSAVIDDLPKPKELVGTPAYYSVEHLIHDYMDESVWPDTRSDVFTLGIIFYELLTGQKPFVGKNDEGSLNETAMIIANEQKMPMELNKINGNISRELSDLIISMLNVDKTKRPSMKDVHGKMIEISSVPVSDEKPIAKNAGTIPADSGKMDETSKNGGKENIKATSASSYLESEPGDLEEEMDEKLSTPDETHKEVVTENISSETNAEPEVATKSFKLVSTSGETVLDINQGIPQINSRYLSNLGIKTTKNSGRIFYSKEDNCWKLYTSKFVSDNLLLNDIIIHKEQTKVLSSGDIITVDGDSFTFIAQEDTPDLAKLKATEKLYNEKEKKDYVKEKVGEATDLILKCGDKEIKVMTVSTLLLSSRNLMDFELYSIKNLGSISVDLGQWKIYPSKFSRGVLLLNSQPVEHPTVINHGDIISIQDKEITVNFNGV